MADNEEECEYHSNAFYDKEKAVWVCDWCLEPVDWGEDEEEE